MKRLFAVFAAFSFTVLHCVAADIFSFPTNAESAAKKAPAFDNASCTFAQEKFIKTSGVTIKSGGNFQFIGDKGVIFETTYPIHSVTSYTSNQNRVVGTIIKAVSNKNYGYLEKNFDLFYLEEKQNLTLALKPKKDSNLSDEMKSIVIFGTPKNGNAKALINKIIIDTAGLKNTLTFSGCR